MLDWSGNVLHHITMSAIASQDAISVEDFLSGERLSDIRHEYVAGQVFAMAGASKDHNRLAGSAYSFLSSRLGGHPCEAFMNDMKVRLRIGLKDICYYPDVVVGCDPRDTDDYFLRFPKLIIEVLSESTERLDRLEKFEHYISLPSLEEYLLVAQDKVHVTIFRRSNEWQPEVAQGWDAVVEIRSLGLVLPLSELYGNVRRLSQSQA